MEYLPGERYLEGRGTPHGLTDPALGFLEVTLAALECLFD